MKLWRHLPWNTLSGMECLWFTNLEHLRQFCWTFLPPLSNVISFHSSPQWVVVSASLRVFHKPGTELLFQFTECRLCMRCLRVGNKILSLDQIPSIMWRKLENGVYDFISVCYLETRDALKAIFHMVNLSSWIRLHKYICNRLVIYF